MEKQAAATQTEALSKLARQLAERVKELTLLHGAARLLQARGPNDQVLLTELAALVPPAWLHADACEARIVYGTLAAHTPGWGPSAAVLAAHFHTSDGCRGSVEVAYRQAQPPAAEGPFLAEERMLIDSLAEMLTTHFERRLAEERVARVAYFDPVTGLPNRASLEERLPQAVKAAAEGGRTLALVLMNLNHFRDVNSTFGHRNGDLLLRQIANNLRDSLGQDDLLASVGGDEFVIVLAGGIGRGGIEQIVARIEEALRQPAHVAGIPVNLEGSIGVALYPEHGDTAELLWQRGDVALQTARDHHRAHLLYSPDIDHFKPQRIALLGELPAAIEQGQLVLHYQPKVSLATGRCVGIEALVRWQHPQHGLVYPDRFILLAERTQVINPLTRWVLRAALAQLRQWNQAGCGLELSVNLSARNLLDADLCADIPGMADEAGIPLSQLTLELTESAIMADPDRARVALDTLHAQGITFSMDDFGIGQSSLTYLRELPFDRMKIDKSFLIGFAEPRNAAIVRAAIELGHSLGLQITAEGIEDETTLEALRTLGCEIGQGYLFSRPLPPERMQAWLFESPWGLAPAAG